jgi:hypothetical protein
MIHICVVLRQSHRTAPRNGAWPLVLFRFVFIILWPNRSVKASFGLMNQQELPRSDPRMDQHLKLASCVSPAGLCASGNEPQ